MFSLHVVLLSQYGISIVLLGNHWENGGNRGDNGERASLLYQFLLTAENVAQ